MKRAVFFLFSLMVVIVAWADDITVQQALQQAQSFIQQREATGSRPQRVKGSASQLTMLKQVSGLYLFNINDNGGFVSVSNDDRTIPILGYSDSGAIDPDNIPSNMRAWLQGYADEIAWIKEHSVAITTNTANSPQRVGSHSTAAIAPLVSTKWDQGKPYNNLCPQYASGYKSATGCVATAMAQVMKYHEWPQAATTSIPGYTTDSYGLSLSSLSATTFNWANMLDSYSGSYTSAQANAVATLMKYCGWSVKMDYGPSSGSNTDLVAEALRNYFDYNSETTQFVSRSFYTAAKWTDLIYNELAQGRPVVYGGLSSGGGHEFVCDGYKFVSGTDYFHINWGWGGDSDEYFVLSSLNPYSQGIGGSSSNDGFHFGQDAVIGIQPSTGTGTIANITPNVIDLTVNSMTPALNPAYVNMEVGITLNITNNSADDYDGDIFIGEEITYGSDYSLLAGNNYFIAAGETKEFVIPFTPPTAGTYKLVLFLPNTFGSYSTDCEVYATLEVIQGTTNSLVPIYGLWCDELSRSQFIIPATGLENMANTTLTGVTFFSSNQSVSWGSAEFDVYLKEVSGTTLSSLQAWDTLEKVYAGKLSISDSKMVITFDTPYQYKGGNLLVGINQTKKGSYKSSNWIGTTVSGVSLGGYGTNISQQNFLPARTFDFEAATEPVTPSDVAVSDITASAATVVWTGNADSYDLCYGEVPKNSVTHESAWLKYDDGSCKAVLGDSSVSTWTWGVMYPGSQVTGDKLTKVSWYEYKNYHTSDISVNIYSGGNTAPGKLLHTFTVSPSKNGDFHEVTLASPLSVPLGENLWITLTATGTRVLTMCSSTESNNQWLLNGSSWTHIGDLISDFGSNGWMIRAQIERTTIDEDEVNWQTVTSSTSPCVLTWLKPQTDYVVKVRGCYGSDVYSPWSSSTFFTTLEQTIIPGDANGDSKVNLADVVAIVNSILGKDSATFVLDAADMNKDGKITIVDAVTLVMRLQTGGSE